MSQSPWRDSVHLIRDGEPVDAAATNTPLSELAARDRYLYERVNNAELGEAVVAYGATLAPEVRPDMPVAWDAARQAYAPALADAVLAPGGHYVPGPVADCVGVCRSKDSATRGDVVLSGRYATALAGATADGPPRPGRYYLSPAVPGGLVRQRPPVSVPVLYWTGEHAIVRPEIRSFLEEHVHYRFALACRPAGGSAQVGGRERVDAPDPAQRGWLPADHPSFGGRAPVGAAFGYNLAADADLAALWPPLPLAAVVLVWDRGFGGLGGTIVPQGPDGLVVADRAGLWWMSDCVGDVPWPAPYDSGGAPPPVSPNGASGPECPRAEAMRLDLAFTAMLFATDKATVTSLRAAAGSPLAFTDCAGRAASAGDLVAHLDLAFTADDVDVPGGLVFKELDGDKFRRGYVTEGLVAGPNVTLASTAPATVDGATVHRGVVTVSAGAAGAEQPLAPQVTALQNARETPYGDVLYLSFPAGRKASIVMRMNVPSAGLPPAPQVRVRAVVLGTVSGTVPQLAATALAVPRPAAGAPRALPAPPQPFGLPTNVAVAGLQYFEAQGDAIPVAAGDTLFVTIARAAGDGYTGDVGLLRVEAVLVPGT